MAPVTEIACLVLARLAVVSLTACRAGAGDDGRMKMLRSLLGSNTVCAHKPETTAPPSGSSCEECGSTFNLRLCATCGHVGCCESQAGDARRHALDTGHPVIKSLPLGGGFTWCYVDSAYVD